MTLFGREPVKVENFNTNNAWGYGGGVGKQFTYPSGAYVRKGYWTMRTGHQGDFFCVYDKTGKRIFDVVSMNDIDSNKLFNLIASGTL